MKVVKMPSIEREKVWVDPKVAHTNYQHGVNHIEYKIYSSKEDPTSIRPSKDVCLRKLKCGIKDGHDRVLLTICIYSSTIGKYSASGIYLDVKGGAVTPKQCSRWLTLCKKYKLMPRYILTDAIKPVEEYEKDSSYSIEKVVAEGSITLDISKIAPSQLYLYASSFRQLREEPGFVKCVLHLVDKCKMNFYVAYAFASRLINTLSAHHPIGLYNNIYTLDNISEVEMDICWPIRLKRFAHAPQKYDKRDVYGNKAFDVQATIAKVLGSVDLLKFQEFFDNDVVRSIMAKTDAKSKEYLNKFLKRRGRIVYGAAKEEEIDSSVG